MMATAKALSEMPQAHISRWWRVVGGLSMNLALGTLYAWSVFVAPLEKEFGWKRAQTSNVFTIAVVVFALSFIVAGRLQDKFGPFWVSLTGGVLVSLGFFLCSYTHSLNYLYICFGVIGGLGNGFGYATPIPVMAKWFPDKRGLAVGLAVAGYGGGSAIFGPLANLKLIPAYGVHTTFMILGVIFLFMTAVGALLLQNPPMGYKPSGWTRVRVTRAALPDAGFLREVSRNSRLKFALAWLAFGALVVPASLLVAVGIPEKYVLPLLLVVILPFQYVVFCIRRLRRTSEVKEVPWTPPPAAMAATRYEFSPGEVLRTPTFYFMWIAYALGPSAGLMVISQLVPFAKSVGIPSAALATMGLVVGAVGNVSGRILSGWMSDALGRLNVLRLMIAISMIAMPVLYKVGGNVAALYVVVFIVYWCYGTQGSVNASTTSDFWGTKNAGLNYGMLFTAWGVAGIIGPRIGGVLFDKYKNYQMAFYTAAVLAAVALLCEFAAKRPRVPSYAQAQVKATA